MTPEERLEIDWEGYESEPDWDWEDTYYYRLCGRFFSCWDEFQNTPILRCRRWLDKLNEGLGGTEILSQGEWDVFRGIIRAFGGMKK